MRRQQTISLYGPNALLIAMWRANIGGVFEIFFEKRKKSPNTML